MTINDFLNNIISGEYNNNKLNIDKVEKLYNFSINSNSEIFFVINSMKDESIFFDDKNFIRLISLCELLDFNSEYYADVISLGIIPCFDCGDNDFISYDISNKIWLKFNISDAIRYAIKNSVFYYFE